VTRLTATTPSGAPVVLAAKAGHNGVPHNHNGVPHNHNDVDTFVLHVDGETFLCDPERGLYDLYLKFGHDANVFANSYGHSVPHIGGHLQSRGVEFGGQVTRYDVADQKCVEMQIEGAYEAPGLERTIRAFQLGADGELILIDTFSFSDQTGLVVEEAFVTWNETTAAGRTARIFGEKHILELTIEQPEEAVFELHVLEEESLANHKPIPLKRLSFAVDPSQNVVARVRARALPL
jgi:hypothetical protein